jgi:hypothetical protein
MWPRPATPPSRILLLYRRRPPVASISFSGSFSRCSRVGPVCRPPGEDQGHPYRVPVNNKNTFFGPKTFAARKKSAAYRFGSAVCCFCSVTFNVPKRPGSIVLFRACLFSLDSFVESAGRWPTALSCSHPSGSRPRPRRHATAAPGPIPTPRDQNNVSTAPGSMGGPSHRRDRTHLVTDLVGPGRQTCWTPDAGERDFDRPSSFRDSPEQGGGRPITSVGPSQPLGQDRPPPLSTHPNTRVRSKSSCRFII